MLDADKDDPTYLVCAEVTTPLHYPDNLLAECHFCKAMLQRRPNVEFAHRPICWSCWVERHEDGDAVGITATTLRESMEWFKKRNTH